MANVRIICHEAVPECAASRSALKPSLAASPAHSTMRAKPAIVNGEPRSLANSATRQVLVGSARARQPARMRQAEPTAMPSQNERRSIYEQA
jgi:hypothetical protein